MAHWLHTVVVMKLIQVTELSISLFVLLEYYLTHLLKCLCTVLRYFNVT